MDISPEVQKKIDDIKTRVRVETLKWITEQEANLEEVTRKFLNGIKKAEILNLLGVDSSWHDYRLRSDSPLAAALKDRLLTMITPLLNEKILVKVKFTEKQENDLIERYNDTLYREIYDKVYRQAREDADKIVKKMLEPQ